MRRPFQSINRTHRSQQVREQLERAIFDGEFEAGERLPSERELAEAFGVSRVSVREALRSMEALGAVTIAPGRGCFVADRHGDFASIFGCYLERHGEELFDLLKVRRSLDSLAAAEAAEHADADAIAELEQLCDAFEDLETAGGEPEIERLVELDLRFHELLAAASGSALIGSLVCDLNRRFTEARRVTFMPSRRLRKTIVEHRAIVQAVAAADPERARTAMEGHVDSAFATVLAFRRRQSVNAPNMSSTSPLRAAPRTDPSVRNYRTGLLPWVGGVEALHRVGVHDPDGR